MKISLFVARIAERFARHPWWVLGVTLALSIIALWATLQLPIYTSRQALLPKNTEVTQRFDAFLKNFGAASDLIIVLEGAPTETLETYATQLANKLRVEPEIGLATDRLDMGFFLQHAYLLMPSSSLEQIVSLLGKPTPTTSAKSGLPLQNALQEGVKWSKNHPPLAEMGFSIENAGQTLGFADFILGQWHRYLFSDKTPDGLDWNDLLSQNGAGGMGNGYFTSRARRQQS